MNTKTLVLILCGVSLFLAGGCSKKNASQKSSDTIKVKVALTGPFEENVIVTGMLDKWQQEHPGISVAVDYVPEYYSDKILTEIAADAAPDIIYCDDRIYTPFFFKDVFLDLSPFIENDKSFNIKRFYPETVKRFASSRKQYCLPAGSRSGGAVFYNKTMFKKSGAALPDDNWNVLAFLETAKKLTSDNRGRHPGEPAFNPGKIQVYGYAGRVWENFVYCFDGRFVDHWDDPARCLLGEKAAVAGMQFAVDLSYRQHVSPEQGAFTGGTARDRELFVSGKLGMFQAGTGEIPGLRKDIGDRFEWDMTIFPKGPTGGRGFKTDVSGYAIYQMTNHPKEAWEVLKCLTDEAGQEMLADAGFMHPSDIAVAQGPHWAGNASSPANKKALNDAVKYSIYEPFHQMWREAWDRNGAPRIEQILSGKMPVQQGLEDIAADMNKFLRHK